LLFSIILYETWFANIFFFILLDLQTSLGTFAVNSVEPQILPSTSTKQSDVFNWDEPDFNLFPKSLEPFNPNSSNYNALCRNTSNGYKMNGTSSGLDIFRDLFRSSDFDEKPRVCSPMDFDKKKADNATSYCPGQTQDLAAEARANNTLIIEPSVDELFSLIADADDCSDDLQQSESGFPAKLHRMLADIEKDSLDHIVSWVRDGAAFKVHDADKFVQQIMPLYFDQTKYESFRRQLNLYGFSRVSRGASRGFYYHQLFLKIDSSLCVNINRPKSNSNRAV
jgi:hypothetical protein